MSKVFTNNQNYHDIAEAIREKNNTMNLYKPSQMADAIRQINNFNINNGEQIHIDHSIIDVEIGEGSFILGEADFSDFNFKECKILEELGDGSFLNNVLWQQAIKINDELFCCCIATDESPYPTIVPSEYNPILYITFLLEPDENKNLVIIPGSARKILGEKFPFNIEFYDNNKVVLCYYNRWNHENLSRIDFMTCSYYINVQEKSWKNITDGTHIQTLNRADFPQEMDFDTFKVDMFKANSKMYFTYRKAYPSNIVYFSSISSQNGNVSESSLTVEDDDYVIVKCNENRELTSDYGEGFIFVGLIYENSKWGIYSTIGFISNETTGKIIWKTSATSKILLDFKDTWDNFIRPPFFDLLYYPSRSSSNIANIFMVIEDPNINGTSYSSVDKYGWKVSLNGNNELVWTETGSFSSDTPGTTAKKNRPKLLDLGEMNNENPDISSAILYIKSNMMSGEGNLFGLDGFLFREKNKYGYPLLDYPNFELGITNSSIVNFVDSASSVMKENFFSTFYNQKNNICCFAVGKNSTDSRNNQIYVLGTGNQTLGDESSRKLFFNNYNYIISDEITDDSEADISKFEIDRAEKPTVLLSHNNEDNIKIRKTQNITTLKLNKNKIITLFLGYNPEDSDIDTRSSLYGIISNISDNGKTIVNSDVLEIANNVSMFKDFNVPHQYPDFSNLLTYSVGNTVRYNEEYYTCTVAVTTAGEWTGSSNWAPYEGKITDNEDEGRKYNAAVLNEHNILVLYQDMNHQPVMKKITISDLEIQVQTMSWENPTMGKLCYLSNFKIMSLNRLVMILYIYDEENPSLNDITIILYQISGNNLNKLSYYNISIGVIGNFYPLLDIIPIKSNEFLGAMGFFLDTRQQAGGTAAVLVYFASLKLLGDKIIENTDGSSTYLNGQNVLYNVSSSIFYSFAVYDDNGRYKSNIRRKILLANFMMKTPLNINNYSSEDVKPVISCFEIYGGRTNQIAYNYSYGQSMKNNPGKLDSSAPYVSTSQYRSFLFCNEGKIKAFNPVPVNFNLINSDYDFGIVRLNNINEALIFAYRCLDSDVNSEDDMDLCIKILNAYPNLHVYSIGGGDNKVAALTETDYNIKNGGLLYFLNEGETYYPEQVKKRQIIVTNTDLSEQYTLVADEGMTWGEWIDSTYATSSAACMEFADLSDSNLKKYAIGMAINGNPWYIYIGDITDYSGTSFILSSQIKDSYTASIYPPNQVN